MLTILADENFKKLQTCSTSSNGCLGTSLPSYSDFEIAIFSGTALLGTEVWDRLLIYLKSHSYRYFSWVYAQWIFENFFFFKNSKKLISTIFASGLVSLCMDGFSEVYKPQLQNCLCPILPNTDRRFCLFWGHGLKTPTCMSLFFQEWFVFSPLFFGWKLKKDW